MKNINSVAKLFIVCGVIFCIGMVLTIGGAAAGGVDGMKKIAEKNDWISDGPGELTSDYYLDVDGFDKVDVSGDADVFLVTEKYFTDKDWLDDHDLGRALATIEGSPDPEAGQVLILRGDQVEKPEVKTEKGVLTIKAPDMVHDGINFDFSDVMVTPQVYVFCRDDELESIKADMLSGDLNCTGISFKKADIDSASGDVSMKDVTGKNTTMTLTSGDAKLSGKLSDTNIDCKSGDVKMSGKLTGETLISLASGDAEIDAELAAKEYTLDLKAISGDLKISDGGDEEEIDEYPAEVQRGDGPNKIKVETASGDIDISFQMPVEL